MTNTDCMRLAAEMYHVTGEMWTNHPIRRTVEHGGHVVAVEREVSGMVHVNVLTGGASARAQFPDQLGRGCWRRIADKIVELINANGDGHV